jgi:hypothetical protein
VALILTGAIFLIGFMLNGVIADYKEAEKLPGDIGACLAGLEDLLVNLVPIKAGANHPKYSRRRIREAVLRALNAIFTWLGTSSKDRDDDSMFDEVARLADDFCVPVYDCGPPCSVRLTQEVARLRFLLVRVSVIARSTYLPAGYALVEGFVLLACVLVVLAKYSSVPVTYAVIVGVTIIYGGMLRLLNDVDNPFEYTRISEEQLSHDQSGSTEIDLGILLDYRRGLARRIAADGPGGDLELHDIEQGAADPATARSAK